MRVSIGEICVFANSTPTSRNFIGGEMLINVGHVVFYGKMPDDSDIFEITAFCLQTLDLKSVPHEIKGKINKEGKVISMKCSCKAGLGSACKHVLAVLFYYNRYDLEGLNIVSCTDKKCMWNEPQKSSLEKYQPQPLQQHDCILIKRMKNLEKQNNEKKDCESKLLQAEEYFYSLEEHESLIRNIMVQNHPSSALAKHILGRHELLQDSNNNFIAITPQQVEAIFDNQKSSELLLNLSRVAVKPLLERCEKLFHHMQRDVYTICTESRELYSVWLKERQFRITSSNAYTLYTYGKNKNPDWKKKSLNYFYGNEISNCYTKHDLEYEPIARKAYEDLISSKVVECGLIVSKENQWLACSPDGILFLNNKPFKLIEIKCPYEGRKKE